MPPAVLVFPSTCIHPDFAGAFVDHDGVGIALVVVSRAHIADAVRLTAGTQQPQEGVVGVVDAVVIVKGNAVKGDVLCGVVRQSFLHRQGIVKLVQREVQHLAVFVGSYPRTPLDANTKVETLVGGESLNIGTLRFSVMALPGHTAGGIGYIISDALFCGDTAFYGNIGRTDLPTGDFDTLKNSIKKICRLPDNTVLYCGHGESTTVGAEKMHNPYFQFGAI